MEHHEHDVVQKLFEEIPGRAMIMLNIKYEIQNIYCSNTTTVNGYDTITEKHINTKGIDNLGR